ncbi:DUF7619 domain-containing protein [Sabulibacter ruber]|uniref:DUF7619 domain-containing protein n=1 Tax=Sabulibacter ruber TaxID=2811901 RepID=UPI001A972AE0|nr:IPT/TIG domain-containing protein [Sabulibacter ruber]
MKKLLLRLAFFQILFFACFLLKAQIPDFKLNRTFGTPVYFPNAIEVDNQNYLYILEGYSINKLDQAGNLVKNYDLFIDDRQGTSVDLSLDKEGNIYVINTSYGVVQKFNPEGKLVLEFGSFGSGPGQMSTPNGIDLDEDGNIYVADTENSRVLKFDKTGKYLFEFKEEQSPSTYYIKPIAVRVGKNGIAHILINDLRILKLNPQGQLIETLTLNIPNLDKAQRGDNTIALDEAGNIYLSDLSGNRVHKTDARGKYLQSFGTDTYATGHFSGTKIGMAIGSNGKLYTTDRDHHGGSTLQVFNATGALEKRLGNTESFNSIAQDKQGNYYLLSHYIGSYIKKYNSYGQPIAQFGTTGRGEGQLYAPVALAVDNAGYVYCLESTDTWARIQKFTSDGRFVAKFEEFGVDLGYSRFSGLALDAQGNMYVSEYYGGCVRMISPTGKFLTKFGTWGRGKGQVHVPKALAVDQKGNVYIADFNGNRIQKFNPAGQVQTVFSSISVGDSSINTQPASIAVDLAGNLFTWNGWDGYIRIYHASGKEVSKIPKAPGYLSLNVAKSKLLVLSGNLVLEYLTGSVARESLITGNIYHDANGNCTTESIDKPLAGIVIKAEPGPYYGISDELGNYNIPVDTGTFTVTPVLPQDIGREITPVCVVPPKSVTVESYGTMVKGPDFGNRVVSIPILNVSLSSNRRRRCFQNVTSVSYSNTGFATAYGARVTVQLPEYVSFISASAPYTRDHKGNYVFDVGNLQPSQRGIISITDSVSCADPNIRGLTVCTKAWITPGNTYPPNPAWNQANITVSGTSSAQDQTRFVISNKGTGNMTDSLTFRVFQDQELLLKEKYKLSANDSLVLRFNPTGRAVRVEVDQPQGHPVKATAGANVEIKSANTSRLPSLAMSAFPPDDPEPEITEECLPIIDSFDPNDKQVLPVGLTSEHYTPTNTPLRYTVRFQNTGTDVAYRVVVVDTLSNELDLSTLQIGAVSHPYQLEVNGKGQPVLTFTFSNIMLPDSSVDQAGSNGFIQFSIKPKAALPEKTRIENFADIFFDYNEPVRTNTTVNRIWDMPQEVNPDKQLSLKNIVASPVITGFSPAQSRAGQQVTITGRNFAAEKADNRVTFNGVATAVQSATATSLTVMVPTGAFTGKIKVETPDGSAQSSTEFIIFQPPTLTAITPAEAVPGSVVTLTGTHFSSLALQDTVTFNGVAATTVHEASENSLKVEVPVGATSGKIRLKTLGGQVESAQSFVVWHPPTLTEFSPGKGKTGTTVTLQGSNFAEPAARNFVWFGDATAQVIKASANQLTVSVPKDAASGKIRVQTPGGTVSSLTSFTFIPAPVITSFTPASGNAGTVVTITGKNFNADAQTDTVLFSGKPAKVLKATETSLQVQAPKYVQTGLLSVTGAGGKAEAGEFMVPDLSPAEAIRVYPNPSRGELTINWLKANFLVEKVSVYNSIGQLVSGKELNPLAEDEVKLDITQFGPGIYTLRFQTSNGFVIKRVTVL